MSSAFFPEFWIEASGSDYICYLVNSALQVLVMSSIQVRVNRHWSETTLPAHSPQLHMLIVKDSAFSELIQYGVISLPSIRMHNTALSGLFKSNTTNPLLFINNNTALSELFKGGTTTPFPYMHTNTALSELFTSRIAKPSENSHEHPTVRTRSELERNSTKQQPHCSVRSHSELVHQTATPTQRMQCQNSFGAGWLQGCCSWICVISISRTYMNVINLLQAVLRKCCHVHVRNEHCCSSKSLYMYMYMYMQSCTQYDVRLLSVYVLRQSTCSARAMWAMCCSWICVISISRTYMNVMYLLQAVSRKCCHVHVRSVYLKSECFFLMLCKELLRNSAFVIFRYM